ncbi:glycosyltransferase [candidate division KSB1 bacterium]|nr:glycosyltransferase [candidate division KSB1 bacterium]RQW00865.1 MAG: glycosyltransferase [candidate division KSB1 bacterium]
MPCKILNISTYDHGGAGSVAYEYNQLLQQLGHQSVLLVQECKRKGAVFAIKKSLYHKLKRKLAGLFTKRNSFLYDYHFYNKFEMITPVSARRILKQCPFKPDIILLYWVTDFINARVIHKLCKLTGAKIYWLMMDNAPLTGGCHYPWDCTGYQSTCENCPAIIKVSQKKLAKQVLLFKNKYLPAHMTIVAFSETDYQRALSSALARHRRVARIIGFIDENKFYPADKRQAKEYWGISPDKKVLFFGAANLADKRKGMALLTEAINSLAEDLLVMIAGSFEKNLIQKETKVLGFLHEEKLVKAYQAADLFLCPSLEDSGPMMINQALMCGTPVVAFDTGVARDLVITGETGYRARLFDIKDFAKGLKVVLGLDQQSSNNMSKKCRQRALDLCGRDTFVNHLEKLLAN